MSNFRNFQSDVMIKAQQMGNEYQKLVAENVKLKRELQAAQDLAGSNTKEWLENELTKYKNKAEAYYDEVERLQKLVGNEGTIDQFAGYQDKSRSDILELLFDANRKKRLGENTIRSLKEDVERLTEEVKQLQSRQSTFKFGDRVVGQGIRTDTTRQGVYIKPYGNQPNAHQVIVEGMTDPQVLKNLRRY